MSKYGVGLALGTAGLVTLGMLCVTKEARADPESFPSVRYENCVGWGLCVFRVPLPVSQSAPGDGTVSSTSIRVRLRGVGDSELEGVCSPEKEAAHTIRTFVEGILRRAGHIALEDIEPGPQGSVLATVRVDGTDVVDILIHIGLGRQKPLPPASRWCD